jgi:chemotaxis protein CheX
VLVTDTDLAEIVESVWATTIERPLSRALPSDRDCTELQVVATIHISGAAELTLLVASPEGLARDIAAAMFGLASDEVDDELVFDALGEVANILGGNVKGLIASETQLSLPAVSRGVDVKVPGGKVTVAVHYDAGGQPLVIELIVPAADAASGTKEGAMR